MHKFITYNRQKYFFQRKLCLQINFRGLVQKLTDRDIDKQSTQNHEAH